ncbi:MAG: hypothetical protein VB108_00265 [Anaerolineaceae bacterium]|nr:hypothetical protein [Anaerolineaceae bacterium]
MNAGFWDHFWLRMVINYLIILLGFAVMGFVMHKVLNFPAKNTLILLVLIAFFFFAAQGLGLIHISIF